MASVGEERFEPKDKETMQIAEFELEKEDVFHLKNLYKLIYEWFMMHGFTSLDASKDDKIEKLYWQRILPNGNSEHHIWWRTEKIPNKNNYYKYVIKFDFQTLNMGKTDIVSRGQKIGTNKGDVILRCRAYLVLDYNRWWRNHSILKLFYGLWKRYVFRDRIEHLKTDLWVTTYKLEDVIKQYLNMKTPHEMQKPFHPELGV
jgi:hypothetical protein